MAQLHWYELFGANHPRPPFGAADKLFWVMLRQLWVGWERALILIQPETVVRWHRKVSDCIGRGFLDTEPKREESVSAGNCGRSFSAWYPRTRHGVRRAFMEN